MTILILCLICAMILPYIMKVVMMHYMKLEGHYDNNHPRIQQAHLTGLPARALAAHQNGFEALIVFSVAVLTAIATLHIGSSMQFLAIFYIISRIIYNLLYLKDMAAYRSLCWVLGLICCFTMMILCMI